MENTAAIEHQLVEFLGGRQFAIESKGGVSSLL